MRYITLFLAVVESTMQDDDPYPEDDEVASITSKLESTSIKPHEPDDRAARIEALRSQLKQVDGKRRNQDDDEGHVEKKHKTE